MARSTTTTNHPRWSGHTSTAIRRIRWYGFPRDINGDGFIKGYTSGTKVDDLIDVVPVRDVAMTFSPTYDTTILPNTLAFERHLGPGDTIHAMPPVNNYADPAAGVQVGNYYTAAWGPNDTNRPKMIRIIATVDDPNGRLGVGQTYEYVIKLP